MRGSSAVVVRSKGRAAAPSKRLKQCERGATCPYKHEHQHTAEYSHDIETKPFPPPTAARAPPIKSKGQKLGGSRTAGFARQQILADAVDKRLKTAQSEVIDLSNDD